MDVAYSTQSSSHPSRSQTVSSISEPSEAEAGVPPNNRPLRKSQSSEKKFSLDGYNGQMELEDVRGNDGALGDSPGTFPDAVYYAQMPRWRTVIRRQLIKSLKYESKALGAIQVSSNMQPYTSRCSTLALQRAVRTRWLDTYFLYSSALGSHTFFMSALPALFYFGHGEIGRG
jgi:hypothetical protein